MSRESEVLEQLKVIIDPDLGKDIVSLGFIKNLTIDASGAVSFAIELTTPACPVKEKFRSDAEAAVRKLAWVTAVDITMTAQAKRAGNPLEKAAEGLKNVKHIIAVASCKGGVGKSTVAVNLAASLLGAGARVGIFDADVYGPSLPTMVSVESFDGLYQRNNLILPIESQGLKLMSFAYASQATGGGPAVMRGPMVTQIINQLLTGTDWGELDYLVIDMPPGTGDIQLTLSQIIPITASILVTTPQEISFVDVKKGLQMFDKLKIPTVAAVENMAYFVCDGCDKEHRIFGTGAMKKLTEQFGMTNVVAMPIDPAICEHGDHGVPIVLAQPDGPVAAKYRELVDMVVREVAKVTHGGIEVPMVVYEPEVGIHFTPVGGTTSTITARDLRLGCKCAHCIEEMTGRPLLNPATVPADITPKTLDPMGNYAVSINWSDGHGSIYPYDAIAALV